MTDSLPDTLPLPLAKRIFDIIVSTFILLVFSPLFLLIVLAITVEGFLSKEKRGPIFYGETRISQGQPFRLLKFRIFKTAAYQPSQECGQIVHTKPLEQNRANLTAAGKIIKKFYLDELPQLLNVLKGEMSLVGTRPWNPVDYQKEIERGIYRKKIIKAGLTGPVQIHKADARAHGGEHKLDNDYIEFCRLKNGWQIVGKDIKILWQSFWFMIRGQGL